MGIYLLVSIESNQWTGSTEQIISQGNTLAMLDLPNCIWTSHICKSDALVGEPMHSACLACPKTLSVILSAFEGDRIAAKSRDGHVRLWSSKDGQKLATMRVPGLGLGMALGSHIRMSTTRTGDFLCIGE